MCTQAACIHGKIDRKKISVQLPGGFIADPPVSAVMPGMPFPSVIVDPVSVSSERAEKENRR